MISPCSDLKRLCLQSRPEPTVEPSADQAVEAAGDILLNVAQKLVVELHPYKAAQTVTLDSILDRDLGLDSLARVELILRVEKTFDVQLPEQLLGSAETPRDLLRAVHGSEGAVGSETRPGRGIALAGTEGEPAGATTLLDVLDWHVKRHPRRTHVLLYPHKERREEITYLDLFRGAERVSSGLRDRGLEPGQSVAIMLPTSREFFYGFYGVLLAGAVPVPIYPPTRPKQIEDHLRRQFGILASSRAQLLIATGNAGAISDLLISSMDELRAVVTIEELSGSAAPAQRPAPQAGDAALLQYTSGSTGSPKGVVLTHANLLANIRAMGRATKVSSEDVFVSWLPLYHDMGLIGACLGSLYHAFPLVLMSPLSFIARPGRWLWAIHEHRGTISAAPNFAYELCQRAIDDRDLRGLDLSSWRLAFNGAEPVSPRTIEGFCQRFAAFGLRPQTMTPVYGLAECSVGLTFSGRDQEPVIDCIQRDKFCRDGMAIPAAEKEQAALQFVSCGQPIPGHEIRIIDAAGHEVGEREEGWLQFSGPSATSGYFHNSRATKELFDGRWLNSGDFAYMAGGNVFLTGRAKDIIIRAGRNIYPQELEDAVGGISGIRQNAVAAFASNDPVSATERLVIMAETRERNPEKLDLLRGQINDLAMDLLDTPVDDVVLVPPNTVLKTSSGKVRRAASREVYEQNKTGATGFKRFWLRFRLKREIAFPRFRRGLRALLRLAYAAYAWLLFLPMTCLVWTVVAVLPNLSWRRLFVRWAAHCFLWLVGAPVIVHGRENFPDDRTFVVVSNHASYLDGVVLIAVLPVNVAFVAKQELNLQFVAGLFLRRLGTEFVERFEARRGVEDVSRLIERIQGGQSIVMMPEGTFDRAPGLKPFHMGAFMAVAEGAVPVVPVAVRGTRSMLRGDSLFPTRGIVSVIISKPVRATGSGWAAAVQLRDKIRHEILLHCGEPDLCDDSGQP